MDRNRIKRLQDNILRFEARSLQVRIARRDEEVRRHRNNPSGDGVIDQMREVRELQEMRELQTLVEKEIADRKEAGRWNPDTTSREVVKKDNPPIPPNLKPVNKPILQEPLEGEELPIKVMDQGVPRAWRPSDGPIHGGPSEDTITDVSKTTDKKPGG